MKRRSGLLLSILIFVLFYSPCFSEEIKTFKPRLSMRLTAGWGYKRIGEVNTYLDAYDAYLVEMTYYEGGKIKRLNNWIPDFEGELKLEISPRFAVGIGIGYLLSRGKSDFEFTGPFPFQSPYIYNQSYFIDAHIRSIPLKLGIYYNFRFSSRISLFINGGVGLFFSEIYLYKYHTSAAMGPWQMGYVKEETYRIDANGAIGFHVGAGFEFKFTDTFALVFEALGRYARMEHLRGKRVFAGWFEDEGEEEGILYYGKRDLIGYGYNSPDLIISPRMPTGNEFKNVKEAALDLSGFSLRAGISIRLF